jgi:hypothetical protein
VRKRLDNDVSHAFRNELAECDIQFVMGTGWGLKTTCRLLVTTEMQQGKRYRVFDLLWLRKTSGTGPWASKVEKAVNGLTARV